MDLKLSGTIRLGMYMYWILQINIPIYPDKNNIANLQFQFRHKISNCLRSGSQGIDRHHFISQQVLEFLHGCEIGL